MTITTMTDEDGAASRHAAAAARLTEQEMSRLREPRDNK